MLCTNALAYLSSSSVTNQKSFITLTTGDFFERTGTTAINLFSLSMIHRQNKLECLCPSRLIMYFCKDRLKASNKAGAKDLD